MSDNSFSGMRFGRWTVLYQVEQTGPSMWACLCDCGTNRNVLAKSLKSGKSTSCGCFRRERASECMSGANHHSWRGGRRVDSDGYVKLARPIYPWGETGGYQVPEHRFKMECHLGRHLYPEESVHHKNGVRDDNRMENLELWSSSHPNGQRVEDKVKWAQQILKRYGK